MTVFAVSLLETEVSQILNEHIEAATKTQSLVHEIAEISEILINVYQTGKKLLLCGNGGSATDSQHIAAELVGQFLKHRRPLPAIALTTNCASITAVANDYGYEQVFSRQLEAYGQPGDVLIAISTSGNSKNILNAVEKAKEIDILPIGLTGQSGGLLKEITDYCLCVPSNKTPIIQEIHILIGHILSNLVENAVC